MSVGLSSPIITTVSSPMDCSASRRMSGSTAHSTACSNYFTDFKITLARNRPRNEADALGHLALALDYRYSTETHYGVASVRSLALLLTGGPRLYWQRGRTQRWRIRAALLEHRADCFFSCRAASKNSGRQQFHLPIPTNITSNIGAHTVFGIASRQQHPTSFKQAP